MLTITKKSKGRMLTIGEIYTWKPEFRPSGEESEVGFYVDDWINTGSDDLYISGIVVYDDGETAIIKISDMSPFMFPFTLFINEVENRLDFHGDDSEDIYQKYLCLHIASMASLFFFDEIHGEIVEALFDDDNQFLDYDLSDDFQEEESAPEDCESCSLSEKIEILLPSEEIDQFTAEGVVIEQGEAREEYIGETLFHGESEASIIISEPYKVQRARSWLNNCDCAILTAWRSGKSRRENDENNRKMQRALREYGYGVAKVRGCYQEIGYDVSKENSFLTFDLMYDSDKFLENVYNLSEKFEQDCFLYKKAGYDEPAVTIGTNDKHGKGKIKLAGRLHIGNLSAKDYIEIGSGRITFE